MSGTARMDLHISLRDRLDMGLNAAKRKVNSAVGSMQARLNGLRSSGAQALSSLGAEIPELGSAFALLTNPIALGVAAVGALGTAIAYATKKANAWWDSMAQINVTAELTKKQLGKLSDKLLEIGSRNVAPLEEIPKAFNRIISAGLSVNKSMAALEPTLRAAKAGFSDIETVASAAVSVMQSSGEEVNKVYDILFATVKSGNAEFKDIARYLPKIIPLAKNVGFALDETAGAYAALTTKLSAEQSSTALEGIMRSLSDDKIVGKFKKIGIDVFDFKTGKVKPILDIMKQLESKMRGLTDNQRMKKMGSLGLDQSSSVGFGTMIQDIKGLQTAIDDSANSQGALNKAYTDSLTPMESWKIIWNQIQVYIVQFGELFLPIMSAVGNKVLEIINYFKNLYDESVIFRDIVAAIGWVFEFAFNNATAGMRIVWNLIKNVAGVFIGFITKIWNGIKAITGFSGSFTDLYLKVKPLFLWMKELLGQIGSIMYDIFTLDFMAAKDKIANFKFPNLDEITAKVMLDAKKPSESDTDLIDDPISPNGVPPVAPSSPIDDSKVISGGGQAKNLTINIGSLVETVNTKNDEFNKMNPQELEKALKELLMRVIRSGELAF
ncbi:phage tail tape measure protein [Flavobacterium sp. LS1R47]|uniref:Phage tail tape measure protein n=1 Tax=Flavobacterium frigoritolerans TaxID=2987686 RepID=A0A9X3HNC9_9FLAO|nr:phage tail tape measure protein [Flavobacterium frigoritolerans]MCV9934535.1 phage tail tape measure protein [Flavobacterium frigoritolerans]